MDILISTDNRSKTNNGIFEGWGTSLCWWANRIGYSDTLTKESARLFFSEEGLSLNIMRYNIGGGDNPEHNHILRTDSEIPGWWQFDETEKKYIFNSDVDHNQLNVLRAAYIEAGKDAYVEAFSNSPPFYMTVSGCTSGNTRATSDNLRTECIDDFAEYLAKVCKFINEQFGIKIKSLSAMNEPFTKYWYAYSPKQEGCFISPGEMQSKVLLAAAATIKKYGLSDTILTASDETNTVLQYIALKMLKKEALSEIKRISTHTYSKATPHLKKLAQKAGKNIWMDESDWSSTSGEAAEEMGPALWLSEKIIEDINTLSVSAWVIWQIIAAYISIVPDNKGRLDMQTLPDLTKGYWGTAFADIDNEKIILTQKYYAFGQFTKYIKPGMSIIHTNNDHFIAAIDKEKNKTVIVAVNTKLKEEKITFLFQGIDINGKTLHTIRTSGNIKDGEHWTKLEDKKLNGSLTVLLKGNSVTTFIID